jgi:hypothetical protein
MLLVMAALVTTIGAAPAPTERTSTKTETFDSDPGWEGVRNRIKLPPVRKQQNFGYSETNHSGAAPGEIGGVVWRSVTPAYYGKKIAPLTFDNPLSASGTIACVDARTGRGWQTGSTVWVGFFNSAEQGWRPINFIGFRLEVHSDTKAEKLDNRPVVDICYGTSKWAAGGTTVNAAGGTQDKNPLELDEEAVRHVPPDGSKHTWELRYDPKGGDHGTGEITLVFDGATSTCRVPRGHREQGATFDRFGIFNTPIAGDLIEAYLDDITINGEKEDFSSDPNWDGKGNHDLVMDTREYGAQDFGYSPDTNHAGGAKAGELGGFFQSVDPWEKQFLGYYADPVGPLTMDHKLVARGKFSCENEFSTDSTFALGWFNSDDQGWPLKNFVGVYFDSLSDVGRIAQPMYCTKEGAVGKGKHVTFLPDGTNYDWTLEYDPAGAGGRGTVTFTINGQATTATLEDGARKQGATLNRFGVFNLGWANSKHCVVWLDDITYTNRAE